MSISKRLLNAARAELKSAARKVRSSAGELLGGDAPSEEHDPEDREEPVERDRARGPERAARPAVTESAEIRRYYANLELPLGATTLEVKAAYRRLMRRYHPDLHQADGAKAEVATKLAQELRVAYERLLEHLEQPKGR